MRKYLILLLFVFCLVSCGQEEAKPQGHVHEMTYVEFVEPTCDKEGVYAHYHCNGCGKDFIDEQGHETALIIVANKIAHNFEYVYYKAPSCTEEGTKLHLHCTTCNKDFNPTTYELMDDVVIPAQGHKYDMDYRYYVDDVLYIPCTRNKEEHVVSITGVKSNVVISNPSCTSDGHGENITTYSKDEIYAKTGIKLEEDYVRSVGFSIPSTGHTFAEEWSKDLYYHWHAATCSHNGLKDQYGSHELSNWEVVTEVSETQDGLLRRECSICDYYEEQIITNYTKASFEALRFTHVDGGYAVTLISSAAPEVLIVPEQYEGEPVIEIKSFSSANLKELILPNTLKKIDEKAFANAIIEELIIPDSVTTIEDYFVEYSGIKKITLPNNLEELGKNLFGYARVLEEVNIGSNTKTINNLTFYHCNSLKTINVASDNQYLKIENGILLSADGEEAKSFLLYNEVQSLIIPDSVKTIANKAFSSHKIIELTFGPNLELVGDEAFAYMPTLKTINFNQTTPVLGKNAFITMVENPSQLETVNYHGDLASWINYPSKTELRVSSLLTIHVFVENPYGQEVEVKSIHLDNNQQIAECSFAYMRELEEVTLYDGLTAIPDYAFINSKITQLVLYSSIKSIGKRAFGGCTGLTTIRFYGSQDEWNKIEKGDYWNYSCGLEEIICNDGRIVVTNE